LTIFQTNLIAIIGQIKKNIWGHIRDSRTIVVCPGLGIQFAHLSQSEELTLESALAEAGARASFPKRLAIQDGRQTNCIDVEAIDWVDAAGDYMCVHVDGETFVLRGTMKRLEELLDPSIFVRIHRSAIVNRHRVQSMRPHRNGEYFLRLDGDHELKLSRKYKSNVSRFADAI
jgi:two-component system LytT family response regulator